MKAPSTLTKESRQWWTKISRLFDFDETGFIILKTALECYDEANKAKASLEKYGPMIVNSKTKAIHKNPALEQLKIARGQFLQAWRLLGVQFEPPGQVGRPPGDKRRFENEEEDF